MKNLAFSILLLSLSQWSIATELIPFEYEQDFKPEGDLSAKNIMQYPLHFEDVAETNRNSFWWPESCWQLTDNGVAVVASRVSEVHRRKQLIYDNNYDNPPFATIRGYRIPWLTLFMGDEAWADYELTTTITLPEEETAGEFTTAGVAFRFKNARNYYAALLGKDDKVQVVYRPDDREFEEDRPAWDIIGSADYDFKPGETYELNIEVNGNRIVVTIDGKKQMELRDMRLKTGKVAFLADNPVEFGSIRVAGQKQVGGMADTPVVINEPVLRHTLKLPDATESSRFGFEDMNGDGLFEVLQYYPAEDTSYHYHILELDGNQLWSLTEGDYRRQHALIDINSNGRHDLVVLKGLKRVEVLDGRDGHFFYDIETPKVNYYLGNRVIHDDFDETNPTENKEFPTHPSKLTEIYSIAPVKMNKTRAKGFYLKDNYWNIWVYDNFGNFLWHRAISTGHFPITIDSNQDGIDEIVVSNSLLDSRDGSILWDLGLEDHNDKTLYTSLNPGHQPEYIYIAHGEAGLLEIDPRAGELRFRGELGHVQSIGIGNFVPGMEGKQLIAQNRWREDNIHFLYDKDMKRITSWALPVKVLKRFSHPVATRPIRWAENGHDVLLDQDGNFINPLTGKQIRETLGATVDVLDDTPWGNQILVVFKPEKGELQFYSKE